MKAKIEVRALNAWFRTTHALRDVSLTVPENSVLAIIGPSGCGKSTFVRCINRMHELVPGARQSGEVLIDGQDLHARRVDPVNLRRRVGMVFQRPNPFPTMSIFDNVVAGLRLNGVRGDYAEVAENSLRQAALWDEVKDRLDESAKRPIVARGREVKRHAHERPAHRRVRSDQFRKLGETEVAQSRGERDVR